MSDDLHDMGRIMEQVTKWESERDEIKRVLVENVEGHKHIEHGQARIFEALGKIDAKLNTHSERITRVEDRTGTAIEKIDRHEEGHWKQAALNVSIVGLAIALWKWINGK